MIRKEYSGAEARNERDQRCNEEGGEGRGWVMQWIDYIASRQARRYTYSPDRPGHLTQVPEGGGRAGLFLMQSPMRVSTPPRTRSGIDQEKAVSKQCTHCARLEKAAGFPRQASAEIGAAASEGGKKKASAHRPGKKDLIRRGLWFHSRRLANAPQMW